MRRHLIIHSGEKSNNCMQSNSVRCTAFVVLMCEYLCAPSGGVFENFFSHRYHSCTDLIFFMAFANMCVQIVLSVKSLCTYLTCEHTFTACMNLKMPCKVSFFEHISTFITFLLLMPLNVVMVHFGSGYKRFFTLCTDMLKHCPDLTKSRAELALDSPKSKSPPTI